MDSVVVEQGQHYSPRYSRKYHDPQSVRKSCKCAPCKKGRGIIEVLCAFCKRRIGEGKLYRTAEVTQQGNTVIVYMHNMEYLLEERKLNEGGNP